MVAPFACRPVGWRLFFVTVNQVLVRLWTRHQQVLVPGQGRLIRFWPLQSAPGFLVRRSIELSDRELLFAGLSGFHSGWQSNAPTVVGEGSETL